MSNRVVITVESGFIMDVACDEPIDLYIVDFDVPVGRREHHVHNGDVTCDVEAVDKAIRAGEGLPSINVK